MARCCGSSTDSCSCVVTEGDGIDVTGEGTFEDPYVVAIVPGSIEAENITFDPSGDIAATDVQAAIEELDTEKAPLASPVFTGDPQVPTAPLGDVSDSAASTAFVASAVSSAASPLSNTITNGDTTHAPDGNAVFDALAAKADLINPVFTGNPQAPTPAAGDNDTSLATTAFVQEAIGTYIVKTADESVTSSTTLQVDNHFTFPVVANGVYLVELRLLTTTATPPGGTKAAWNIPSGSYGAVTMSSGTSSPSLTSDQVFFDFATASFAGHSARIVIGATGGTATLKWAQNSSNATATTWKAGSWMIVRRVA